MLASPLAAPGSAAAAAAAEDKVFTNPLASHPVGSLAEPPAAMLKGKHGTAAAAGLPSSGSSSSIGAPSSGGGEGGGDRHLRRMTQSLVEILESMSSSVQQQQPSKGGPGGFQPLALQCVTCCLVPAPEPLANCRRARSPPSRPRPAAGALPGAVPRAETAITARGDSVATMADLEAGHGGAGGSGSGSNAGEEVVPVHHVRRLTTTLVDILRHVTASSSAVAGQQHQQQRDLQQRGQVSSGGEVGQAGRLMALYLLA